MTHWPISILSTAASIINLAIPLALVRMVDPHMIGQYKLFFLYLSFVPALSFMTGMISGLAYWGGRRDPQNREVRTASTLILIAAFALSLVAWFLRDILATQFHTTQNEAALFALAAFGAIATTFFDEATIATGRIWTGALFYSGFEVLRAVAVVTCAAIYRDLTAVLAAHASVSLIKAIAGYAYAYRLGLCRLQWDSECVRTLWQYAFPVSLAWLFGSFFNAADQFVVSTYINPSKFALYSLGCLMLPPLFILEQSVTRILIPQLSNAFLKRDPEQAYLLYRKSVGQLAFLLIPATAGLIVFSRPIVELLFTTKFIEAARYLPVFAISYLFMIFPYDAIPRAKGQGQWILGNFVAFSLLSLFLCVILTRSFGPFGALGGMLLSKVLMRIYALHYIRTECGWKLRRFLPFADLLRFGILSLLMSLVAIMLRPLFSTELVWLFVMAPMFVVGYFVCTWLWKAETTRGEHQPLSIVTVTQYLGIGGLEKTVFHLSRSLKKHPNVNVTVYSYDKMKSLKNNVLNPEFEKYGIKVVQRQKSEGFSFATLISLLRIIRENSAQVLHSHDLGPLVYSALAKLLYPYRLKLVHTQHGFFSLHERPKEALYHRILRLFVDEFVVVSPEMRDTYVNLGVPRARVQTIRNGVNFYDSHVLSHPEKLLLRRQLREVHALGFSNQALNDNHWILHLARLHPIKGQAHTLELWAHLREEVRSRCLLFIVGAESHPGETARLQQLIACAPNPDRIKLVEGTQAPFDWLMAADLFISPSESEGMPLGPIEAVGCGLPAVLSDIKGHAFLKPHSTQYPLSNPERGAAMITAWITRLEQIGDEGLRAQLWDERQEIRETFSVESMANDYLRCYHHSLGERGGESA